MQSEQSADVARFTVDCIRSGLLSLCRVCASWSLHCCAPQGHQRHAAAPHCQADRAAREAGQWAAHLPQGTCTNPRQAGHSMLGRVTGSACWARWRRAGRWSPHSEPQRAASASGRLLAACSEDSHSEHAKGSMAAVHPRSTSRDSLHVFCMLGPHLQVGPLHAVTLSIVA